MASKTCITCIYSRGYQNPDRDSDLLFRCMHPIVYYADESESITDILCTCQRSYGFISAIFNSKCGVQGRFYKRRGSNV